MSSRSMEPAAKRINDDDIAGLKSAVVGEVVAPGDAEYEKARQLSDPAFQHFPAVIVYCKNEDDVGRSLAFARRFGFRVTCRSGGHSTAGYSVGDDAVVIDTGLIKYVRIATDDDGPIVHVGAGCDWGYVGAELDKHGLHVPGGGCEAVAVAGYMQGGGYSYTSRMFGMNCDNVLAVRVMLADGRTLIANATTNFPLFWAIRGGTGNNFGVLLEVTYRAHRPGALWGFAIRWGMEDAPRALFELQNRYMKTNSSRLIGFETQGYTQDGRQVIVMHGMYRGAEGEAVDTLFPVLTMPGATLEYGYSASYYALNQRHESKIGLNQPAGVKEIKQSGYLREPLSLVEWEGVIGMFTRAPNPYSIFNVESYGGAINAVGPGENAFIHRDAYCDFFLDVFWGTDEERGPAVRYLDDFMAMMKPYFERPNGRPQSYQNYPRATQRNYLEFYFDGFVRDLVAAKRLYDPTDLFRYEQGIPLEYPEDVRVDPKSPGFSGNEKIVALPQ